MERRCREVQGVTRGSKTAQEILYDFSDLGIEVQVKACLSPRLRTRRVKAERRAAGVWQRSRIWGEAAWDAPAQGRGTTTQPKTLVHAAIPLHAAKSRAG
eukprot:1155118-Pelagomonas_calceolata.AAC.2